VKEFFLKQIPKSVNSLLAALVSLKPEFPRLSKTDLFLAFLTQFSLERRKFASKFPWIFASFLQTFPIPLISYLYKKYLGEGNYEG